MQDAPFYLTMAATGLIAITIISISLLHGWREWVAYKRMELREMHHIAQNGDNAGSNATSRIEIADLKERLKKLEAIAAGVEL